MQTRAYLETLRNPAQPTSARLRALAEEVERLESEGHTPIGAAIRGGRLVIELAVSSRLARLAHHGEGAYYAHGHDDGGHWRRGVLLRRTATVFWTERGN